MKQIEAIKKAREIAKEHIFFSAISEMTEDQNGTIKTDCKIVCAHKSGDLSDTILVSGRNFKECLFLLECKVNGTNEEDQDGGN